MILRNSRPVQWFFGRDAAPCSVGDIVVWWELRRIPYNLFVLVAGIISLILFYIFLNGSGALKPGEDALEPASLLLAPFVVNILYCTGPVVETFLHLARKSTNTTGPRLMRLGIWFSLTMIALPSAGWFIAWVCHILRF